MNRDCGKFKHPDDVFNLSEFHEYSIKAVHMPIIPGMDVIPIEAICDSKDMDLLHHVFYIANYFGKLRKESVIVVLHSDTYYDKLSDVGDAWSRLVRTLDLMLKYYPYTEVVIENVTPICGIGLSKELHLTNNFAFDNVQMVRILREELKTDRIGTCLDTCHAMLADKYITAMYKLIGDVPVPDLSLGKYFNENKDFAKLIHLCDIKGSGYGKGRHGVPFHIGTYDKLAKILNLYKHYSYTCPITLEVEESDFTVCDVYKNTKEQVDLYYKQYYTPTQEQLKWCRENAPEDYKEYNNTVLWALMKNTFFEFHNKA